MRVLMAVFLLAAPLAAQAPPRRLESMGLGCCTLRVRAFQGKAQGKFIERPSPGRLTLAPCEGNLCPASIGSDSSFVIPPDARIEVYSGRAVGKGLVLGAVIGAATVTAIWLGDQDLDQSTAGKITAGLPVGAILGGALGALIGALFPHWTPVQH